MIHREVVDDWETDSYLTAPLSVRSFGCWSMALAVLVYRCDLYPMPERTGCDGVFSTPVRSIH
jgi:hypothetical protein